LLYNEFLDKLSIDEVLQKSKLTSIKLIDYKNADSFIQSFFNTKNNKEFNIERNEFFTFLNFRQCLKNPDVEIEYYQHLFDSKKYNINDKFYYSYNVLKDHCFNDYKNKDTLKNQLHFFQVNNGYEDIKNIYSLMFLFDNNKDLMGLSNRLGVSKSATQTLLKQLNKSLDKYISNS